MMVHSAVLAAVFVSIHVSTLAVGVVNGFSVGGGVAINGSLEQQRRRRRRLALVSDGCTDDAHHDDNDDDFFYHDQRRRRIPLVIRTKNIYSTPNNKISRHHFLSSVAASTILLPSLLVTTFIPKPSYALVKGNAPPPKMKPPSSSSSSSFSGSAGGNNNDGTTKCRNVEECQEQAERAEMALMQREAEKAAYGPKPQIANGRTRYLDVVVLEEDGGSGSRSDVGSDSAGDTRRLAKTGDTITIYYKVLKLGKRSYDGLSGEGTVVFSRGYALEDDEKVLGDKSFTFVLGDTNVIQALNDAIPGMGVGSTRRISVTPQSGWEKNIPSCDGGPGGKGVGGELRTDYVVVPTATMVEQEACFDRSKLPFPSTYAQERRMAQRFDQSLIMEVQLVNVISQ